MGKIDATLLKELKLVRNEDGIYSLKKDGDIEEYYKQELGFDSIVLNPETNDIKTLAGMVLLFGLTGRNITAFNAVKDKGFVASFEKNGQFAGTFLTSEKFTMEEIKRLFEEEGKQIEDPVKKRYYELVQDILNDDRLQPIRKASAIVSLMGDEVLNKRVNDSIEAFKKANTKNCKDNDIITERIVCENEEVLEDFKHCRRRFNALSGTDKELSTDFLIRAVAEKRYADDEEKRKRHIGLLKQAFDGYDKIFNGFIIQRGYYAYSGRVKPQDQTILNSKSRIEELNGLLVECFPWKTDEEVKADIIDLQNMCSTDYTADAVEGYLGLFAHSDNNKSKRNKKLSSINIQGVTILTGLPSKKENKETYRVVEDIAQDLTNADRSYRSRL